MDEAMKKRAEGIAFLCGQKAHEGFVDDPSGRHVEESGSRLAHLADDPPPIHDQPRQRGFLR